jgi:hypothetical protein
MSPALALVTAVSVDGALSEIRHSSVEPFAGVRSKKAKPVSEPLSVERATLPESVGSCAGGGVVEEGGAGVLAGSSLDATRPHAIAAITIKNRAGLRNMARDRSIVRAIADRS